jgi:thiol-disulfide isomerase/thioredoxin
MRVGKGLCTQLSLASVVSLAALVVFSSPLAGCRMSEEAGRTHGHDAAPPVSLGRGVRIVPAPEGADVLATIKSAKEHAETDGRDLLVYIGATWCEPCRYFHDAAAHGDLDHDLARVTFLEFDLDRDGDALRAAGYTSRYVPLFVVPGPDGRPTQKRVEGSVKGPGAPAQIAARIKPLLGRR